jgi:alpha-1,2-mannosyltransferase
MYQSKLRDACWLTADRADAAGRIMLFYLLVLAASIPWLMPTMWVGRDFGAFWTAAELARHGHAADAYGDPERSALVALFGSGVYPPFFYPPTALLFWLPFAFLPFAAAVALWTAVTGSAYAMAIRTLLGGRSVVTALAYPGVLVCALYGQNSFLSAALLSGAALTLDRYPALAGILIGLLAYKPQLALLAPLALAMAGRWRTLGAAAFTVAVLLGGSVLAFGVEPWIAS